MLTISIISLTVSILGIIISGVAIYIAIYVYQKVYKQAEIHHEESLRRTEAQHENNLREARINPVVGKYQELLNSHISSDIDALTRIGISNLLSEEEAREAIRQIANLQGGRNPLSSKQKEIEEVGVLRFFQNITRDQLKIQGKLDEIIGILRNDVK